MLEEGCYPRAVTSRSPNREYPQALPGSRNRTTDDLSITMLQGGRRRLDDSQLCISFRPPERIFKCGASSNGARPRSPPKRSTCQRAAAESSCTSPSGPRRSSTKQPRAVEAAEARYERGRIRRNVTAARTSATAAGCPTTAKQSMLVTCAPTAVRAGLRLYRTPRGGRLRAHRPRVSARGRRVLDPKTTARAAAPSRVKAKATRCAAARSTLPRLLLRSASTPRAASVVACGCTLVRGDDGMFDEQIPPFQGAPQSGVLAPFHRARGRQGRLLSLGAAGFAPAARRDVCRPHRRERRGRLEKLPYMNVSSRSRSTGCCRTRRAARFAWRLGLRRHSPVVRTSCRSSGRPFASLAARWRAFSSPPERAKVISLHPCARPGSVSVQKLGISTPLRLRI